MSNTQVFVIQQQSDHGHWDLTGEAFLNEDVCRERVNQLVAEDLYERLEHSELAELLNMGVDEVEDLTHEETLRCLKALDDAVVCEFIEEKFDMRGTFSYETCSLMG